MTVDEAFQIFQTMVAARGGQVCDQLVSQSGDRLSTHIRGDESFFRLKWDKTENTLTLEISHGPGTPGGPTWWMDLIKASLVNNDLRFDTSDFNFKDAIEHGLELQGL